MQLNLVPDKEMTHEAFGISKERAEEMFNFFIATMEKQEDIISVDDFLKELIEPCVTFEEAIFIAYQVGKQVEKMQSPLADLSALIGKAKLSGIIIGKKRNDAKQDSELS